MKNSLLLFLSYDVIHKAIAYGQVATTRLQTFFVQGLTDKEESLPPLAVATEANDTRSIGIQVIIIIIIKGYFFTEKKIMYRSNE